ncbi:MAG: hypothetical protein WD533_03830, partial [Dehalococcoidia bacterium]
MRPIESQRTNSFPLLTAIALAAFVLAAVVFLPSIARAFAVEVELTSPSSNFGQGQSVPFEIVIEVPDGDDIDESLEISVSGPRNINFPDFSLAPGAFGPVVRDGMTLQGNKSHDNMTTVNTGYGIEYEGGTGGGEIVITGTLRLPEDPTPGEHDLHITVGSEEDEVSFFVTQPLFPEDDDEATPTPEPTAGPLSPLFPVLFSNRLQVDSSRLQIGTNMLRQATG